MQRAAVEQQQRAAVDGEKWPAITRAWHAQPLPVLLHDLAEAAQVSIVADGSLDATLVTAEVVNMSLPEVLAVIARRAGVDVTRSGRLFYVGRLRPQDRGYLVRRVRALSSSELTMAIDAVKSADGICKVTDSGVAIVADRAEVLTRVASMLDNLEAAASEGSQWCVQLYLISTSDTFLNDLGIEATPAIDLAATYAWASGGAAANSSALSGGLSALLRASRSASGASILAQPLLLLRDGTSARFNRGQRIPLAKKTVTDQGTVSTVGFDFVETGLVIEASVREVSTDVCSLKCKCTLSSLESLGADGEPLTAESNLEGIAEVHSGGVYLLGSLDLLNQSESRSTFLRLGQSVNDEHHQFQLWCRVLRVGGPAQGVPAPPGASPAPSPVRLPDVGYDGSTVEPWPVSQFPERFL